MVLGKHTSPKGLPMTITEQPSTEQPSRSEFELVVHDLYRDVHKGIRAELFAIVSEAGRLDPTNRAARVAVADHVRTVGELLTVHAGHEDSAVQPALEIHRPELAERIEKDHAELERRVADFVDLAGDAADAAPAEQTLRTHQLYLELASFTSAYLEHQDVEERVVMPALQAAIGPDAVLQIHGAIVGSIPPGEMAASLAVMLPAMNVDGRTELLGGMQANAPAEVFQGVWGLAGSVLAPADLNAVGVRLGIA
jgi:hypothetical protein